MSIRRSLAVVFVILLTGGLVHCGGTAPDGPGTKSGRDGGPGGGGTGIDDRDAGGGAVCEPKTCADTEQCGTYDDGCGGTLRCDEACACTPNDFEVTCPPRPCEVVAGCVDGQCQYQPVTCGGPGDEQACAPVECEGEGCGNVATQPGETDKLYACGGQVCAEVNQYCDPSPVVQGGQIVYQNKCIAPPRVACGACDLGEARCSVDTDRFVCDALSVPVLEGGGTVECDSTVVGSTFVFIDVQYTDGGSDGSRERPYTSYGAALSAAQARNARGIVIAGSPTFNEPLVVQNGISVYGGFDPGFTPNRAQRPRWVVPASAAQGNALIGATARNITTGTVLYHLDIETADVTGQVDGNGISNIGLWVEHSTALRLKEVTVKAGDASSGLDGEDGTPGSAGGNANGPEPGAAGSSCSTVCTVSGAPAVNGNKCGAGGRIDTVDANFWNSSMPGNSNGLSGSSYRAGGAAGRTAYPRGCGVASPGEEQTVGGNGRAGVDGADGADGSGGERIVFSIAGVSTPTRNDGENGVHGTWGSGGGAGGSFYQDNGCMNEPNWGGYGGGSGGPGCAGTRGTGGGAGGISAAVVVVGTSQNLVVQASSLTAGQGGNGGRGGQGGEGGQGGQGASGLEAEPVYNEDRRGRRGGRGGDGGSGGRGGHGGGGAAGSSFGIWCETTSMNVNRDGATTITAGPAGVPGPSLGHGGAPGESTAVANCSTP